MRSRKALIKNKYYQFGLIALIISVIVWSIYVLTITSSIRLIIHITTSIILLVLILTKNKYVKLGVKIWSGVFFVFSGSLLILGPILSIVGRLILGEEIDSSIFISMIYGIANLLIGAIVFLGANKYINLEYQTIEVEDHLINSNE
jgi:hypothetical protein